VAAGGVALGPEIDRFSVVQQPTRVGFPTPDTGEKRF
jgi:hypothetical protein